MTGSSADANKIPRYRCREHPDEPVTARGTGCQLCAGQPRRRRRDDVEDGWPDV